jgi:hypothetical protein
MLIRTSMSALAIYHPLRLAFVPENNSWASSVRDGRYVNLAARGNHVVERLKGTNLRQIGPSSQFVDRNRFHSVACIQEVMNATDFVTHKC